MGVRPPKRALGKGHTDLFMILFLSTLARPSSSFCWLPGPRGICRASKPARAGAGMPGVIGGGTTGRSGFCRFSDGRAIRDLRRQGAGCLRRTAGASAFRGEWWVADEPWRQCAQGAMREVLCRMPYLSSALAERAPCRGRAPEVASGIAFSGMRAGFSVITARPLAWLVIPVAAFSAGI
jgi:hypothetical protein